MTLRGILTAQLAVQAALTHEVRLAPAFTLSALVKIPLALYWHIPRKNRDRSQIPTFEKWESGTCPYFPAFTVSARAFMRCDRICCYD